jgi:hypothetical protein
LFWYLQRDFLSLIREFSGGKLTQKGFFHSLAGFSQTLLMLSFLKVLSLPHVQSASGIDARFLKQTKTFTKYLKITTA